MPPRRRTPKRPHANKGKTSLLANIPEHLRSPGRGHILNRPYAWPGSDPPETIPIRHAIPRWMRTAGCHWDEAAAACDIEKDTVRSWLHTGGRVNRLLSSHAINPTDISEYESLCLGFSADVHRAAAEVVTRWQSILERESRGGFTIGRTTVVDKQILDANGQPTGAVERTTTRMTELARPDTALIRWRMSKLLPRYRDRIEVDLDVEPDEDVELARTIAEDLRRLRAHDVTSTESDNRAVESPESPG
jgi:hypothetical protein